MAGQEQGWVSQGRVRQAQRRRVFGDVVVQDRQKVDAEVSAVAEAGDEGGEGIHFVLVLGQDSHSGGGDGARGREGGGEARRGQQTTQGGQNQVTGTIAFSKQSGGDEREEEEDSWRGGSR